MQANNLDILMRDYKFLTTKAEQLRENASRDLPKHEKYMFCLHLHYDKPAISAWDKEIGTGFMVLFFIHNGIIAIESICGYSLEIVAEMKGILDEWLAN